MTNDELKPIKDEILKFCKDNSTDIFETLPFTEVAEGKKIEWVGDDFNNFLDIMKKNKVNLLYFSAAELAEEPDEEGNKDPHEGEIVQIDMAYFLNGLLHVFTKYATWFEETLIEITEIGKSPEKEQHEALLKEDNDELVKQFIEFIKKEYSDTFNDLYKLHQVKDHFWLEKGIQQRYGLDLKVRLKMERVERSVEKQLTKAKIEREKEIMPKLIEKYLNWANENELNKVNKTNTECFLTENDVKLTPGNFDLLHVKVKNKLSKKK